MARPKGSPSAYMLRRALTLASDCSSSWRGMPLAPCMVPATEAVLAPVLMAWKTRWYPTGAKRTPRLRHGPTRCIAGGAGRGRLDVKADATPNGNPLQRHSDCFGRGDVGSCKDSSAGTFVSGPTRTYAIAVICVRLMRSACVRWWVSLWCCATLTGAKRRL